MSDQVTSVTEYADVTDERVWNTDTQYLQSSRGWRSHGSLRSHPEAVYTNSRDGRPPFLKRRKFDGTRTDSRLTIQFIATRFGGEIPIPYWLTVALAFLPTWRLTVPLIRAALRRRNQEKLNHCPTCAYDLRATPNQCPERGKTPFTALPTP